ncbi:MAG: DNA internalization-related competence protein ComEC/Rec2, partial [Nitrospirae bacterium]|nr:DNA internalization-related competence protein ComEC/Rec2 [Nitrospirota bacterium]
GTVIDVPEISGEKIRFTIDNVQIERQSIHGKAKLSASPEYLIPVYGDRVGVIAKLKEPNVFHNPGVYSYDFKKDGIIAVGYVKQIKIVSNGEGLLAWIYKKRQILGGIIDNSLSAENASFHKAIIIGLQRGISEGMRDAFSVTGLAHILSISGTHFALLAFIFFKIIKAIIQSLPLRILTRMSLYATSTQIAVVLTLPVLILYALISGSSTPTIRSMIMIFIYMLALFLGRKGQWLNSLSIAAIIILFWQPNALFDLSFQLSFIAVLSIGYVLEKKSEYRNQNTEPKSPHTPLWKRGAEGDFKKGIKKTFEKIKTATLITIAAVLGTAPMVAISFKQFPLISPMTNLVITPFICFIILPLSFFAGFVALLFNMTSMPLSGLIDSLTHLILRFIKIFSDVPYANLHVHNPSFLITLLYFFSLILLMKPSCRQISLNEHGNLIPPLEKRGRENFWMRNKIRWRLLPLILVICLYLISPYLSRDNNFRITFLDVGQGDSSLVELPDKRVMLIDGGTHDPDMGRRVIAPYLWSKGIKDIDYLVLSHPHPDHYGGLIYIMDNFKIGEAWLNGRVTYDAEKFFQKLQEKKIPYRALKRGDMLEAGDYKIYVFHPYDGFYADSPRGEFSNLNNDSLVLKIDTGSASALFTGDIEAEAERDLVHLGTWLKSDIIKIPHHGGRTSSTEEFIRGGKPSKAAVLSAGSNNPFNHPHAETLERYENAGVRVFRTDKEGAVTIISQNNPTPPLSKGGMGGFSYEVQTYQDSRFKEVNGLGDEIRNLKLLF